MYSSKSWLVVAVFFFLLCQDRPVIHQVFISFCHTLKALYHAAMQNTIYLPQLIHYCR